MSRLIKALKNNRKVLFDSGSFDNWCVYVVEANGAKKAPFDTDYFSDLKSIAQKYKKAKVYEDFVSIYKPTSKTIDTTILELIDKIVATYQEEDKVLVEQWFAVIYGGMIAEENKERAILKKRIKRLGMYQLLMLDFEPKVAANFSRGKKWRDLDAIMRPLGF